MLRYTQAQFFIHFRPNREREPSLGNDALHKHTMNGVFNKHFQNCHDFMYIRKESYNYILVRSKNK